MAIEENKTNAVDEPRMAREKRTITAMIRIYCRGRHRSDGELCAECDALRQYAMRRLDRCPFGPDKPTCAKCPVHCYKPQMREHVREVMRFAGPRMLQRHPVLAVRHQMDSTKPVPETQPKSS
jgi:hypothetical protein